MTRSRVLALVLLLGALISLPFGALAIFVAFGCFLFWVTLPAPSGRERRALGLLTALCLALSFVGLARFVATQAFFGMSEAARFGTSNAVVSRLREIKFAEARAVELALVDPDQNQRGSALFLDELAGAQPAHGRTALDEPLLDGKYRRNAKTPQGPAVSLNGYLFFVCLPGSDGNLSADPEKTVNGRAAETSFVGYGWPEGEYQGHGQVFAIDADGAVLVHDNRDARGKLIFVGTETPPPCSFVATDAERFSPWRGEDSRPR